MEVIDSKTLIKKFHKFFEDYQKKEIKKVINEGQPFLPVSFFDISEYDFELGDQLLANPIEVISIMEETLKQFYEDDEDTPKTVKIRFTSLPTTEMLMIRDIRSEHLGKLVLLEGLVRRKTDVRPRLQYLEYLCTNPSCNFSQDKIRIPQMEEKAKLLKTCPKCKSGVELVNKDLIDSQSLILEEIPEQLENSGDQPKRINVLLQSDLVSPFKDSKTNPGARVYVIGIVKEIPIETRTGSASINYDLVIDGNYIELSEEDYSEIVISKEEEKEIKELAAKDDVMEILVKNTAPSIYGNSKIKEAVLLQVFGGSGGTKGDGIKTRGNIHMLLLGDPGAAKSQLLKAATKIAPKSMFVSGKSASAAGLCVAPYSKILTNSGGMKCIKDLVENGFKNPIEVKSGIWKEDNVCDAKIQSLSNDLKLHCKKPKSIWKLEAPKKVFKVVLSSGKQIELTGNTQLFCLIDGKTCWKKSSEIKEGMFVATPRKLVGGNFVPYCIDLIKANPCLFFSDKFLAGIVEKVKEKYGTLREASKNLGIDENKFYHRWQNGFPIKLDELRKILSVLNFDLNWKDEVSEVSLYNGKKHNMPNKLSFDFLYVAGLIAGDGDISKSESNCYNVRLSNSCDELHKIFREVVGSEFSLSFNVTEENDKRPKATRFHSRILGEILLSLGISLSPKSSKLSMSETLLCLPDDYLAHYLGGLYDADGSICVRNENSVGSDCVEFCTCSEEFTRQIQLVLLRFEIRANLRKREASKGKIKGNYDRWVLEIREFSQIKKFFKTVYLRHPEKRRKLELICDKNKKEHTNVDLLPNCGSLLKNVLIENNVNLKKVGWHENFSRKGLQKSIEKIEKDYDDVNIDIDNLKEIAYSDIFWEKVVLVNEKEADYEYVYDLTVSDSHNFVVDGVLVHNTASVIKDDLTKGWALEAGAMVLASGGLCCTTKDAEFITDNFDIMSFEELFKSEQNDIIYPKFKVLGLNEETNRLEFFKIKQAFKTKNDKKIYSIKTRTGRKIKLTEDNEVLTINNSKQNWIETRNLCVEDFIAVPKIYDFDSRNDYNEDFAYICGIVASDGHIAFSPRRAQTSIYNSNLDLLEVIQKKFEKLNVSYNVYKPKQENRGGLIDGRKIISTKPNFRIYNTRKEFAQKLMEFGIPSGDKSKKYPLNKKILKCSNKTIANFLKGIFDGDGSIRKNPYEITIVTGIEENARLFQSLFLRFGLIANIKHSTRSWHCSIRGRIQCEKFFKVIGTNHPQKYKRLFDLSNSDTKEVKERIDVLPNCEFFFENLRKKHYWNLGKNTYKYIWNYSKTGVCPSIEKLKKLNETIKDEKLENMVSSDILWDKVISIEEIEEDYVYDFTMKGTNNFVANNIIMHNCIDELDKMTDEDTSAMHEALEQQCYHYDFELQFADGSKKKIGDFVEKYFKENEDKIIEGVDCEILNIETKKVLTTDFEKVWEIMPKRISRHKPFKYYYKVKYDNGKEIVVTPKHPIFVYENNEVVEIPVENVKKGIIVPLANKSKGSYSLCKGKIISIEKIKDDSQKWVYDVTVEPTKSFISQGLVLHNTISIAKANIRATLRCETTVLGAANPKYGRFDPFGDLMKQIDFPPALVSRFDLIFIIRDVPDKKKDDLIADHILQTHRDKSKTVSEISTEFLKKYVAYSKQIQPVLTSEAIEKIKKFYVDIRNASADEEGGIKSISVTARQLEAIVRLSEAYAKIKLDTQVKEIYAQKAIDLLMYCLEKIGIDPKTGQLDIDKITSGVTASSRNQYKIIQQIIEKLEKEKPDITLDDICEEAEKQKIGKAEVEKVLSKLKNEGIIFEPRKNVYKRLP